MSYLLSVDLGTTFSAAAIAEGGEPRIASLGSRTATIPSVVALRPDGTVLIGEAAERRAVTEPTRVAREFKRRLGDPVPIIIGGTPYGAEMLMAHLLRGIANQVAEQQGKPPGRIVLSHPANYGPYKLDLLEQVGHLAELDDVEFVTEPQAAAIHYSESERIEPGEVVGVYDLGGGTFDAALVQRTGEGFRLLGTPDGLDRFGGIDLDEAVFMHVRRSLGGAVDALNPSDPAVLSALARLREDCRLAKEGLSSDTDASIPVMLPNLHTEVRLVRSEFEDMIRPRLRETIVTLERVVHSAGLEFSELSRVLLVGGSSRIPLVAEMVREATGRPVALDAHPKHAIVLGAASAGLAGFARRSARAEAAASAAVARPAGAEPAPAEAPHAEPAAAAGAAAAEAATAVAAEAPVKARSVREPKVKPVKEKKAKPAREAKSRPPREARTKEPTEGRGPGKARRRWLMGAIAGGVVLAAAAVLAIMLTRGEGAPTTTVAAEETTSPTATSTSEAEDGTTAPATSTTAAGTTTEAAGAYPPVEGPPPSEDVATIYMTDYVIEGENWGLWNLEDGGAPPEDVTSDYYPALGPYDIRDPATIAQHFAWMRNAGIGTVLVQWFGTESVGNAIMPSVLEMAERYGLSFALLIVYPDPAAQQFGEMVEDAVRSYGTEPRWAKMPGRDGEPQPLILLAPLGLQPDVATWQPVLEGLDLSVVAVSTNLGWIEAGADGLMSGRRDSDYDWALTLPDGVLYVPGVSPGFSGEWAGSAGGYAYVDRRDGQEYRDQWQLSHAVQRPSMVVIDAFNGWFNGSQIEPAAASYPARPASPYGSYRSLGPEGYLELTREMIDTVHPLWPEELASVEYDTDVRALLNLWQGYSLSWSGGLADGARYIVAHNYPGLGYTTEQCLAYLQDQMGWQEGGGEQVVVREDTITREDWNWVLPAGTAEAGQSPTGRIYRMTIDNTMSNGAGSSQSATVNTHATIIGSAAFFFWLCE